MSTALNQGKLSVTQKNLKVCCGYVKVRYGPQAAQQVNEDKLQMQWLRK